MKYFEIQDSPELKYAPQLKDWYGRFDVRDIRIDTFPKFCLLYTSDAADD